MRSLDQIAQQVVDLVAEHDAPNSFQMHDLAGDTVDSAECMRLANTLRLSMIMLNNRLASHGLVAVYHYRRGPLAPARLHVRREAA